MFVESSILHCHINPTGLEKIARVSTTLVEMIDQAKPDCAETKTVKAMKPAETKKEIKLIKARTKC